jgi:putative ABC transport system permease protein
MKAFRTPERTYRQTLGAPQTDIKTENFTVAGVDLSKENIGLILKDQIVEGAYFSGEGQAVLNISYAQKKGIKVGDKLKLGGKEFTVVGFVEPKLYAYPADIYLSLEELQKLAGKENRLNILLIKSSNAYSVEETSKKIAELFPGAKVSDSSDLAKQVTGSLINAANLTNKFVGLVSLIVVLAAFIIVSLLSLLSINKRVNEIGTLKAIGWGDVVVMRQIFMENLALGILGALLGIGLGALLIFVINHFDISLTANFLGGESMQQMARRFLGGGGEKVANIKLKIDYSYLVMLIGAGVAILGSVIAGGITAFKAVRLRPSEALRKVE